MLKTNKIVYVAIFWTILITILSLITIGNIGESIAISGKDKYVHFSFYFVFTILWILFFKYKQFSNLKIVLLIAIIYGILMEIFQGIFTTSRHPDIYDVVANSFGALVGYYLMTIKKPLNRQQPKG